MNLGERFDFYGSDKRRNGYHVTYETLLAGRRATITTVLEIGVGTLDPAAHSTMAGYGADHYRPGGSLRAWRDWFPNAHIWGVDTQPDTMIGAEDRITTVLADSTQKRQLDRALDDTTFDLIVDDGDHRPKSQYATLRNLWPRLKPNGLYVVEDIGGLLPGANLAVVTANP